MVLDALLAALLAFGPRALPQTVAWDARGPGYPYVVALDLAADGTLYAGAIRAPGGVVLGSRDGGETWSSLLSVEVLTDIRSDPFVPSRVYSSWYHAGFPHFTTELDRSADGGTTWESLYRHVDSTGCAVAFDPNRLGRAYALFNDGFLLTSTDGFETWRASVLSFTASGLSVDGRSALWAFGPDGLFRSDDSGASWRLVPVSPSSSCDAPITALAIDPTNPERMFLGFGGQLCGDVRVSLDGGVSWTPAAPLEGLVSDLRLDPSDPSRLYVATLPFGLPPTSAGVLVSADDGASWADLGLPVGAGARELAINADGSRVFGATSAGVYTRAIRETVRVDR